jgi:hypothetical protein
MCAPSADELWVQINREDPDGLRSGTSSGRRTLGVAGEEKFHVTGCTAAGLEQLIKRDGFVVGRHFLFAG